MTESPESSSSQNAYATTYVLLREEGVFISLPNVPAQETLRDFADRVITNGSYFVGLDYPVFMELLYGNEPLASLGKGKDEVKIANSIAIFADDRQGLYKGLKIERRGDRAEYLFEPVFIETEKNEPVYGLPGKDGVAPIIKYRLTTVKVPAKINFDEFVASLWLKGLRFGIDEKAVREAIRTEMTGRITVASQRLPTDSKDAEIKEESDRLHQDRSPLVLPNGRIDIRKAKNRFPQVSKDMMLLRKIPRRLGFPGYCVTGKVIEPRAPRDIRLETLAGEGTRIDHTATGDVLMANKDGFLSIDAHTGQICISTKIENREGVSIKSTGGDISLEVKDFTEHGEVQEKRVVEGVNLTFNSSVFGTVISRNGTIQINGNLSGGRAQAIHGNINIKQKAINSRIEALEGDIHLEIAEECTIIGHNVTVARAVNCEIVGENLQIGSVEGCAVAGKVIRIETSNTRKFNETVISLVLPDVAALELQLTEARAREAQMQQDIQIKLRRLIETQSNDGFANYLALKEKIEAGTVQLSAEQQEGWGRLVARYAPLLQGTEDLTKKLQDLKAEILIMEAQRKTAGTTESCRVNSVLGDTVAQKLVSGTGLAMFYKLSGQQLSVVLRQIKEGGSRIFSGGHGEITYPAT
jgi:uncharacterized protein (DUF342 family)